MNHSGACGKGILKINGDSVLRNVVQPLFSAVYPAGPVLPSPPLQIRTDLPYRGRQCYRRRAYIQGYLPVFWPNLPEKLPKQMSQGLDIGPAPILDPLLQLAYRYRFRQQYYWRPGLLPHDLSSVLFLIRLPDLQ